MRTLIEILLVLFIVFQFSVMNHMSKHYSDEIRSLKERCKIEEIYNG